MRKATLKRTTKETDIAISLNIDGKGRYKIATGIRFFDHMLELFAHHGAFDLELNAKGDWTWISTIPSKTLESRWDRRLPKPWEASAEFCGRDIL